MNAASMITIAHTTIQRDAEGRYHLKDIHEAALQK